MQHEGIYWYMLSRYSFRFNRLADSSIARFWLWFGLATGLFGAFLCLSFELLEASNGKQELITSIDRYPESILLQLRTPKLNEVAINVTALGSATVISIFILISVLLLLLKRRFALVLHLLIAAIGSAISTFLVKSHFERPRPNVLTHLIDVQGYSYPSGHSLSSAAVYFTFAVLLCNWFKKISERTLIIGITLLLIFIIGFSRVYLGVHYVSDVTAGILLGISWASILGAISCFLKRNEK